MSRPKILPVLLLAFALAACDRASEEAELASLDNRIAKDADPALTSALEDQIMVDPTLSQQSNRNNVRPPQMPAQAQVPAGAGGSGAARAGRDIAQAGGAKAGGEDCMAKFEYGPGWAGRMPPQFPVYPGARIIEAAGSNEGECSLRVVTFRTAASLDRILDWYHTRAVRAGFSSEHQLRDADHVLAGTNETSGGAFYVIVTPLGSGSEVALVANRGV